MIGVELVGSMVVEGDVDSSLVRLCDRPFGDAGGPLHAECFTRRRREV
jgi:hypothetical protein